MSANTVEKYEYCYSYLKSTFYKYVPNPPYS